MEAGSLNAGSITGNLENDNWYYPENIMQRDINLPKGSKTPATEGWVVSGVRGGGGGYSVGIARSRQH